MRTLVRQLFEVADAHAAMGTHFRGLQGGSRRQRDPRLPTDPGGDPDSYENYIQAMISDSVDYEGSILAGDRNTAQEYYYGMLPRLGGTNDAQGNTTLVEDPKATYEDILGYDQETANRSTYVSTDVRDAVMLMLPSLIRLFAASENPVFIVPRSQEEVDQAEQMTAYVNYVFWNDNPGFLILYGALKDALTVRTGFVKWWTDENKETVRKRFTRITADQVHQLMLENPTAKLVKVGKPMPMGMPPPPPQLPPSMPPGPLAGPVIPRRRLWAARLPGHWERLPLDLRRWADHRCQPHRQPPAGPPPGTDGGSASASAADGSAAAAADGFRGGDPRPV